MSHIPVLEELAIIAVLGVAVTVLLSRIRLPIIAGLLAAGALLGPFGLGLVKNVQSIEVLADVGVVLLLFTIGLELSLERLRAIFAGAALGGAIQVLATIAAAAGAAMLLGQSPARAVFYGFVLALSSTAIVLRAVGDRGELDAPHGRFIVATLIFQDLCVVPMVLLVPVLASGKAVGAIAVEVGVAIGEAALVVAAVLLAAKVAVPRLLRWVDASRAPELFLLAVLAICVGTTWLTALAGLSVALGAFLGGVVVAETEFRHRAMGDMIPLRDAFVSIFFVSLGMLFDVRAVFARPVFVALLLLGFVVAKGAVATLAAVAMRLPARSAWLSGIGLAQFGELGFVLLKLGLAAGLTDAATSSALLSAGVLSMFLTPLLIRLAPRVTAGERLLAPLIRLVGERTVAPIEHVDQLEGHVLIIGYGVAGRLVGRALASCSLPYIALELNAETVRQTRAVAEPVYYADATRAEALGHANARGARLVVVVINDPQAAERVVDTVHRVAPEVPIVIRTRYQGEREKLMRLGAADVIAEEAEASVEVLSRLLRRLEIPRNVIEERIRQAREQMQTSRRTITLPRIVLPEHRALAELKIESVLLSERSRALGRSPVELDLRRQTSALIVAIRRGERLLEQPDPEEPLHAGDVVYLVGSGEAIKAALELLA